MLDTATLWLGVNEPIHVLDRLDNTKEIINQTGERTHSGKLNNLNVSVKDYGVWLRGSLPKFCYGTNLTTVSRTDIKNMVECLSDALDLKMEDASLYRFDLGVNIGVERSVGEYLRDFRQARYFEKNSFGVTGLLYSNSKRSMCFYDKIREMTKHKEAIPNTYTGHQILRYELRYCKRLGEQLKVKQLTAAKLYEERFYNQLVENMKQAYTGIEKAKEYRNLHTLRPMTAKELQAGLALEGIQAVGGVDTVMQLLKDWKAEGNFNSTTYQRMKDSVRQLAKNTKITESNKLMEELTSKIIEAVEAGK